MQDLEQDILAQVQDALQGQQALAIQGNNTKTFYGNPCQAQPLQISGHNGILHYEPAELVMTARAGTPLKTIKECLQEHGQMLGFEPPGFGDEATLGGTIACNLSGPRRPYAGAARDFVLGCRIINGHGQVMRFGGEVMKNVAGYDVSRLMAGAMGTLGVLLDISIRVIPRPQQEFTIRKEVDSTKALQAIARWSQKPMPISAACHDGDQLYFRLSGNELALKTAHNKMGGEPLDNDAQLWERLREQSHAFFDGNKPLWRLSVPANTPMLALDGKTFLDWGGAQRWLVSDIGADRIRKMIDKVGGHATLYRNGPQDIEAFQPLPAAMLQVQQRLKQSFDPQRLFNPGRLYKDL